MYYRHRQRERERDIRTAFNLEFNDENYAIATPEFWDAWRADTNRTLRRHYAPAKYPAAQLGLRGKKPVWVVFVSRFAKEVFETSISAPAAPETENGELKGLGWHARTAHTGMFFDDRNTTRRSQRSSVVAWLNYENAQYSVNVVHSAFRLTRPIPASLTKLGEAVEWVYQNSVWTEDRA